MRVWVVGTKQAASGGSGPGSQPVREFIARVRQRMAHMPTRTPLPQQPVTALRAVDHATDLTGRFVAAAEAAGCRAYRATEASWPALIRDILRVRSARRVLIEPQPGTALTVHRAAALRATLSGSQISAVAERDDETLFTVDAAVTGVQCAVAETATIVCVSSATSARGASLIPPLHIALVAETQIVPDLLDAFAQAGVQTTLSANVNLITGPSKTADIEGVLVTGVHGPGEVHIVLLAAAP